MDNFLKIVGNEGIEPSTSVLSGQRSTTELIAQVWRDKPKHTPKI